MKKLVCFVGILSIFLGVGVFAGDEYGRDSDSNKIEERQVIYYDFDLELDLDNGLIEAEWDDFDGDGFDWYKLVYSTTNSAPVYPDDKTVFVGNIDQTQASFKLKKGVEYHYIRLCAVVLNDDYSKDRYCGAVQKIEDSQTYSYNYNDTKENICTMDYTPVCGEKDGKQYTYSNKCVMNSENARYEYAGECNKTQKAKRNLTPELEERIEQLVEKFIKKLEDKQYSDDQMIVSINAVITRLVTYKNKQGYKEMVAYMIELLEDYRQGYENPLGDLENIFNDF